MSNGTGLAAPLTRIILRYGLGGSIIAVAIQRGWVTKEFLDTVMSDPDVILVITALVSAMIEGWYGIAKAKGWSK